MSIQTTTPWHKASYNQFLHERLPQLLADRLPLAGYQVIEDTATACRIRVELVGGAKAEYVNIPLPAENGVFTLGGEPTVVIPTASSEELDQAKIACVGEQLYEFIEGALGQTSNGFAWDDHLLQAWLPLDRWVNDFFQAAAQRLDSTNWLSRHTHLRRLVISNCQKVIAPGQNGRVCPFETPESPNIGRVFTVAVGAEIRAEKLVIVDQRPEAGLGLSSSMLPFIENNDSNRLLFAANFQRQSLPAPDPEPALVQTGHEPNLAEALDFWCGRNLLTAFISLGAATYEDAIVISQSAAQRLNFPYLAEAGDKLTNRHGIMGCISQVLPDDEMPHLSNGMAVELVYSFTGLPTRLVMGPSIEAAWGLVAHAEGQAVIVPPFSAPSRDEMVARLRAAGLPETGMQALTLGKSGLPAELPSTVGWVYWNRSVHLARQKLSTFADGNPIVCGRLEAAALSAAGAHENLREMTNTRALARLDAADLAERLAAGPLEQAGLPTPLFDDLTKRLAAAGIAVSVIENKLNFRLEAPQGDVLKLTRPLLHPWLNESALEVVGARPELDEYHPLVEANQRLAKLLNNQAPQRLILDSQAALEKHLKAFLDALLTPEHLQFHEKTAFSARAAIIPAVDLRPDQVGLPEKIAWDLFAPLVIRQLGDAAAVKERQPRAVQALDELMARSWVLVVHAPCLTPTTVVALHPARVPGAVVHLPPLTCCLLNADFDGDQVAIHLPITEAAQQEAGDKLTIAAHLRRDPTLGPRLLLNRDVMWGLTWLAGKPAGRAQIAKVLELSVSAIPDLITQAALSNLLDQIFQRDEIDLALERVEHLMALAFQAIRGSGASLSPLLGRGLNLPAMPAGTDPAEWQAFTEILNETILSGTDYADPVFGVQLLAAKIRPLNRRCLPRLVGPWGLTRDAANQWVAVRHSLGEGRSPDEVYQVVAGARQGLADSINRMEQTEQMIPEATTWTVLARARRAKYPGVIFARAAASSEVDPLTDIENRFIVGIG